MDTMLFTDPWPASNPGPCTRALRRFLCWFRDVDPCAAELEGLPPGERKADRVFGKHPPELQVRVHRIDASYVVLETRTRVARFDRVLLPDDWYRALEQNASCARLKRLIDHAGSSPGTPAQQLAVLAWPLG
jgi:hypothetical protein